MEAHERLLPRVDQQRSRSPTAITIMTHGQTDGTRDPVFYRSSIGSSSPRSHRYHRLERSIRSGRVLSVWTLAAIALLCGGTQLSAVNAVEPQMQAPRFTTQPSSSGSMVNEGRTKILQCHALGYPQPMYRWLKNGVPVGDFDTSQYLKIQTTTRDDAGSYQCLAKNDAGTIFSEKIDVVVAYMGNFEDLTEQIVSVQSGYPAILDLARIESVPAPSVTWQTEEGPLNYDIKYATTASNQLIILSVDENDMKSYRARAINTQIGREEISAFIRVNVTGNAYSEVAPEIIVQPKSISVVRGEQTVQLECIANARPLHELETIWLKDDIPVENSGISYAHTDPWNRTLALLYVNLTHTGQYTCQVQMRTGGHPTVHSVATVTVQEPPSFFTSFRTETLGDYGSKTMLPCDVIGEPVPHVTWFRNAEALDLSTDRYMVQDDHSLAIKKLSMEDSAMFQCLASNEAGEKSSYTWLKVKNNTGSNNADNTQSSGASVLKHLILYNQFTRNKRLAQPRIIRVRNSATGSDSATTIAGGGGGGNSVGNGNSSTNRSRKKTTLAAVPTTPTTASKRAEEFDVDVRPSVPILELSPTNQTVLDGKDATMHCRAVGAPTPNITWVFNESQGIELSGRIQILDSGDLLISNVRESDGGLYTCVRANEAGIVTGEAHLGVMVRTQIVQPPADTTVLLGHTAALQCKVSSDPTVPFNIDWYREPQRQPIKNSQRVAVKADGTLEIVEVRPSDVGQYSCIVTSPGGNETRSARLSVVELPFAPTNVKAVRLNTATHRAINVSWTPGFDGNSAVLKFIIQRREVPELGPLPDPLLNWITELSNVSAGSRWVLLTNLKAATAYQFRVSAVNKVGEGSPSEPSNVIKLPQEAPSGPPVGFVGSARSSSEIITQWQPPLEEHRNGQILGYIIRYRLFGYNASPWNYRNITNEAQRNYLIQELITWKDYVVQIAAYNNMGVGVYTDGAKIKTKEGVPEAPPVNVRVRALNSTAIRIWWKPPNPQQINGINQGYKIQAWRYEILDGEEHETEAKVITVPPSLLDPLAEQDTIMVGLEKFTAYNVTVLCFTDPGDGERSLPIEVKTKEDVPDEVGSLQFDDVSDREVTVMWTPPKQTNGILTGYQVKYQIKEKPGSIKVFNMSADVTSLKVVNLIATTHYLFEVFAWTAVGAGVPRTATIQSGVEPVLPNPPYQLALSNIEAFSVVIQFTPGFDGNSSITKWTVEGQTARNLTWFTVYEVHDPDASTLTVTGLTPFTPYRLRIIASNVVGPSEPSDPTKDFQTIQARPMHPPLNVTVRAMSATELRVRWIPLQQTEWFGNPRGYNITYRIVNGKGPVPAFSVVIEDPTANSHVLDSLEEWSVYEIFMSSVNEVGQSNESPHAFERTREAVPAFGPLGVEANATSSTTIVIKWSEVPREHRNGQIEGYKVFYGSAGRTQILHKTIPNNSTFTTTLTELKKFVQYDIQVLAYTRLGDGLLSTPPVRVQTFEDTPGAPSNVSFPDVSFSMARIIWDVPEEPNGEILAYRVIYLLNGSQSLNFSREFPPSDRTFRATQLLAERFYLFSVTAQTRLGWGKTAAVLVYTTNNREIPQAPSSPQISRSQVQAQQITFSWTPGRDGFAPLRYYTVHFRENEGPWTLIPERVDPAVTSYTALGLKPHTLYQFRIQATNDIGPSSFSKESIEVRTLPAAPSLGITGLKVVPITTTSVRVQWNPLKKSLWNGDATTGGYRILYQPVSDFPSTLQSTPKLDVIGVEQESAILRDLSQDRNYEIIVQPFNSQGSGPPTPPVAVYVGEAVPTGEPRGIDAAPVSSTEVRLRWKAPQQSMQNGELLGYKIFYLVTDSPQELEDGRKHEEEIEVVPASYTSHSLVFLDKYTEYRIQILAFNPAGDGPRSAPITVKTLQGLPGSPSSLSFSEITMNSLKVSWNAPKMRNGEILGYIVTYETTEDNEKFSKQVKQKVSGTSLLIQNLEEEVTYTFTVRAQTIDYGPALSGNVTTGPQDGSPVSPRDLLLSKSQASVDMSWINGPSGKGPILGYYIETKKRDMEHYYNYDSRWETVARTTNGPIQEFTVSFQSLLPSTAYKFRVIAYNRYGISCPVYSDDAILTPSKLYLEYGYLQQKPFYRQTWFMVALAATSIVIIIMVIAVLCVKSKSYKYKQEAQKTLEESMAMSIDERQELALELYRSRHGVTSANGTLNGTGTMGRRTGTILGRKQQTSAAAAASLGKSPPRPSPASVAYHSDEESLKCYDENPDDSSVTEKPSEVSSSDSQASESENESVRSDPHSFVNHYANVNDSLRQSWKRQKPVRNYSSYTDSEPEGSAVMSLNGGQIIMNNMARSRAPLPGFSSFV
ncbi:protein sidekick isoform X3 [Toxorhynchites rutilus septentrionalis]|uniref:protein sidekick isoform X3 n=1 Tax=Toxorhynchites rutilus septentrionalis TaxID=329112 RepID=UPI00247AB687|nr:protein sidekick isoform X3 [Toxorhynchites rutilus septentrionalis]